jgi:myosin heavy subunit
MGGMMKNDIDMGTSGSWAAAGLALGVGIVEGRQAAQRHRENLLMQQRIVNALNLRNSQLNASDQARRQAEMRLLDSMIEVNNLSEQLVNSQNMERQRIARISELRESLVTMIEVSEQQADEIKRKDAKIADLERQVATFRNAYDSQTKDGNRLNAEKNDLLGRCSAMELKASQLSDLLEKSENLTKVWKDRCAEASAQRDDLQSLVDQLAQPGPSPILALNAPQSII